MVIGERTFPVWQHKYPGELATKCVCVYLIDLLQERTCNFASAFKSKALFGVLVGELGTGGKGQRDLLRACVSSGGIPGPVFILAATVVRSTADYFYAQSANLQKQLDFCLAEWATGSRVSVKFDDRA